MTNIISITSGQYQIWKRRKDAVMEYRSALKILYIKANENRDKSVVDQLIDKILAQTCEFGGAIFDFFGTGLTSDNGYWFRQAEDKENYVTGEYILNAIIDQITSDLVVVERILLPRLAARLGNGSGSTPARGISQTIWVNEQILDRLAMAAIQLFKPYMVEHATVLTYFHRSPRVRIIPYAPVALIGLPHAAKKSAIDLMALPHEFGHHLYWNGRHPSQKDKEQIDKRVPLREATAPNDAFGHKLASKNKIVHGWIEEIFADVVSCMIGGPLAAYSIQTMLLRTPAERFSTNDGIHPSPILRPYIHLLALKKIGVDMGKINTLEDNWLRILGKLNIQLKVEDDWQNLTFRIVEYRQYGDLNLEVHAQVTISDLDKAVQQIFDIIPYDHMEKRLQWSLGTEWALGTIQELREMIDQIDEMLVQFDATDSIPDQVSSREDGSSLNRLLGIALDSTIPTYNQDWILENWSWKVRANVLLGRLRDNPNSLELNIGEIDAVSHIISTQSPLEADASAPAGQPPASISQCGIDAKIWSRLLWFDGWTSGPGGPGHIPDHPYT